MFARGSLSSQLLTICASCTQSLRNSPNDISEAVGKLLR
jgi:hypothetical protein